MTKRQILHRLDEVPASFPSEEAEARFWETHELGPELIAKLQPPTDPRLPAVRKEPVNSRVVGAGSGVISGRRFSVPESIRQFAPRAPRTTPSGIAAKSGSHPTQTARPSPSTGSQRPPPSKK